MSLPLSAAWACGEDQHELYLCHVLHFCLEDGCRSCIRSHLACLALQVCSHITGKMNDTIMRSTGMYIPTCNVMGCQKTACKMND